MFEKLLEKRSKFITNKLSKKLTKIKDTKTETLEKVLEPKNFSELILTENKILQNLSPIIEILDVSPNSEPEVNLSDFIPDENKIPQNLSPNIEILIISSDSEPEVNFSDFIPDRLTSQISKFSIYHQIQDLKIFASIFNF